MLSEAGFYLSIKKFHLLAELQQIPKGKHGVFNCVRFTNVEKHNEFEYGSYPSFNGYGTKEEIENEYDLFVKQEELNNFDNWDEIFDLIEK